MLLVALIAVFLLIGDNLTCKFSQAVASIAGGSADCSSDASNAHETENGEADVAVQGPVMRPVPSPSPQQPPWPPAPGVSYGLDPDSYLVETMQSTPRGRQTMRWLIDNYVYVDVNNNKRGAYWNGRQIVLGQGYEHNAGTLIHEANHARYAKEGRKGNPRKLSRDDYIHARIAEEADGVVQAIRATKEFRAAGYDTPERPGEPEYDDAYQNARANGASNTEAEQAGYDAVEQKFYGEGSEAFVTSTRGTTYPEHYGKEWDAHHPCLFGLCF
ncbi:MAG: hypothetical protein FWH11_12135 [Micrococcales bacterium]|nr:hypothetical protein [Micrococcales bacterium]